jgi:hypothetical protein
MADRHQIMRALEKGDFVFLTDLVRTGAEMGPRARALLADILLNIVTGKWKKTTHRPRSRAVEKRQQRMAIRLAALEAEGWPMEAAVTKVAQECDCTTRWVWQQIAEHRLIQDLAEEVRAKGKMLAKQAPEKVTAIVDRQWLSRAKMIYEEYKA